MRDNYRFRDVRSGQGPVNIGRGNRAAGRDYQDNRSWQHIDNRGGHYGDYYDRRAYVREGDNYELQVGGADPFDAMASGRGVGRALAAIGLIIAFAGFGGWMYIIFSFIGAAGPDSPPGSLFDKQILDGIPLAPTAFAAVLVGGVLSAIGASMAKAARRRHEQRMRYRRRYHQ